MAEESSRRHRSERLGPVDGNNVSCCAPSSNRSSELVARQSDRKYAHPALRLVQAIFSQFLHLPIAGCESAVQPISTRPGTTWWRAWSGAGVHRRRAKR
jgi:hypothetical protein